MTKLVSITALALITLLSTIAQAQQISGYFGVPNCSANFLMKQYVEAQNQLRTLKEKNSPV